MLRHPEPKVLILRDGIVLFNPVVAKFMLQDGQMVPVFYNVPPQCPFFRQLSKGEAGVCFITNAKGVLVAEQATGLLERLRLPPWNEDLRII